MLYTLYIAPSGRCEVAKIPEDNRKQAQQIRGRMWLFASSLPDGASMTLADEPPTLRTW